MRPAHITLVAALVWAATSGFHAAVAEQKLAGPFKIKPPEMTIPAGAKRGALRRITQPFGPWILICDENLMTRKRVCNVSQSLLDAAGRTVFSWSLAASERGAPIFIVRLPAALAEDHFAQLVFGQRNPLEASVLLSTCDAATCLGYLPVDARIQHQIAARADVAVRVRVGSSVQTLNASLDGLGQAVASLK